MDLNVRTAPRERDLEIGVRHLTDREHAQPPAMGGDDRFSLAYEELRRVAARYLRRERAGHTLQPTALVHEAYLRLSQGGNEENWKSQSHFVACAARAMRRVLVDHARRRHAVKRRGARVDLTLESYPQGEALSVRDLLALDEAMDRLAQEQPNGARHARLLELVWFGGMDMASAASQLDISRRQAHRDWAWARTWLRREIGRA